MIVGLIGVNGAGKTTYLRNLAQKVSGKVLPDYPNIPVELSAYELLWRVGKIQRVPNPQQRASELCSLLLIDGAFERSVSTYSAGNYKKTALAILLLNRPETLYLDEPLETIDAVSRSIILRILYAMSSAGTDIYISTQDIDLAIQLDRILVFSKLSVVAEGEPQQILGDDPVTRFFELSEIDIPTTIPEWLI